MMRLSVASLGLLLLSACNDGTEASSVASSLELASPASLAGTPGWMVDTIVVRAVDEAGRGVADVEVAWAAETGAGEVVPLASRTNTDGLVRATWTLGVHEGQQMVSARTGALPAVRVMATSSTLHAEAVTAGAHRACALESDGRAVCWGFNWEGALGVGSKEETVDRATPVVGGLRFSQVSMANDYYTCALTRDGVAWCWGLGGAWLGNPAAPDPAREPVPVATPERFTALSTGDYVTCGLATTGRTWCWGYSYFGLLGDTTQASSSIPVLLSTTELLNPVEISLRAACGLTPAGGVMCWGTQGGPPGTFGNAGPGFYPPVPVHPTHRFTDLSVGWEHVCALATDGVAWCWGHNWFGSLGQSSPGHADPRPVDGSARFRALSQAGGEGTIALGLDGKLYRWGGICCDVPQRTPLMVAPELTFRAFDPYSAPDGAVGITLDGAVYEIVVRPTFVTIRGVPPPPDN